MAFDLGNVAAAVALAVACTPAAAAALSQPELTAVVAPLASDLRSAGIQRIAARSNTGPTSIAVLTTAGPIYFAWPANVSPLAFEVEEDRDGVVVRAEGFAPADRARYATALQAVITEAVRRTEQHRAFVNRPRP
jgi:hypothetical protein